MRQLDPRAAVAVPRRRTAPRTVATAARSDAKLRPDLHPLVTFALMTGARVGGSASNVRPFKQV